MSAERDELAERIAFETANSDYGDLVRVSTDGQTPVFLSDQRLADALMDAGYRRSAVTIELESLADFFDEMASLASYSQSEAVMETWLAAAKYARSRIAA